MRVLVVNCGSSSLKFLVAGIGAGTGHSILARGIVERIGGDSHLSFRKEGLPATRADARVADHEEAVRRAFDWVDSEVVHLSAGHEKGIRGIGHRIVHGGKRFTRTTLIDESVTDAIDALEELAPLHNPPGIAGIRAARAVAGRAVPMVAVFDTSFHSALPDRASVYAIPYELSTRHAIRRYGFHGISYQHILSRYCALTGLPPGKATFVAFHLGNGCSAAAVLRGVSVDTSMGFTPLEGLVMGTRSGDLDPAVIGFLSREEGLSCDEVDSLLNGKSGLLGLSGTSRDMRDLLDRTEERPRVRLAVDVFCYRARKYLGGYLAALGGADAVVFSGGIGENAPEVRARILADMEWCGLRLDDARNRETKGVEADVSSPDSRLRVFVIPADEELVIARETAECLRKRDAPRSPGRPDAKEDPR